MGKSGLNKVIVTCAMSGAFAAVMSLEACKHEPLVAPDEGSDPVDTGYDWVPPPDTSYPVVVCDPDTMYFEQAVQPLLVSFCATEGCHDAITHEEGVRLYDYAHIMQQVSPGHPNQSDLLTHGIWQTGDDQMPPSDQPQLSNEQINTIVTWIQQGAQNNSCVPSTCDTASVTFAGTIAPTLNTFCTGCHGGSSPDGGIDLTTHAGVIPVVNDGTLAGAIQHQYGFSAMPPVGSGLSDCRINQVLDWIAQGGPNN